MHCCRAITSQELQSDSETTHTVGVPQEMGTSSWEKSDWKVNKHEFQSMRRAGYNTALLGTYALLNLLLTNKEETEMWKSRAALTTATMTLWSIGSTEKWERQVVQCTVQDTVHTAKTWHFRRADFSLFSNLLGRISWKTTMEGEGKACKSWLIFKDRLLKAQEGLFLHVGIQAGLIKDQHERKGNLWLSLNAKQSTWNVEAGVGGIYRHYLIVQGRS